MGQVVRFPHHRRDSEPIRIALLVIALAAFSLAILMDIPVLLIPSGLGFIALMLI
jgi:hypothetical protein